MADSAKTFLLDQVQDLPAYENAGNSIDEKRRGSADSIKRLEILISDQKDRLEQLKKQSTGTPCQLRLHASMEDVLLLSKQTLTQIRQSARCLEISSAMLAPS